MYYNVTFFRTRRGFCNSLIFTVLLLIMVALNADSAVAGGILDPAFGNGGRVTIDFGGNDEGRTVLVQPDGKIILVGTGPGCSLARLTTDGTLDETFGVGGKTSTNPFPYFFTARGAALQPDGKIVVVVSVGHQFQFPPQEVTLVRYNPNGTLDGSFGDNGVLFITSTHICDGLSVAVQADGKILAGGGNPYFMGGAFGVVVRLNANGTLDMTFDGDGLVTDAGPPKVQIAVQSDGKILVGSGNIAFGIGVSRYDSNGAREMSFPNTVFGPFDVRSDDKILGRVLTGSPSVYRVQRFNSDGSIDPSFVNNRSDFYSVHDIAPASNGQVVEVGRYYDGAYSTSAVSLFNSNGLLIGFHRMFIGPIPNSYDAVDSVSQVDGKILVLGSAYVDASGSEDFILVRYLNVTPTPTRAADFDGDSRTDFAVYRSGSTPTAPSYWHVLKSDTNAYQGVQFGAGEDRIVPADYDGDGKIDFAVFRPSNGFWYTSLNPASNYGAFQWGINGDIPIPGDFDGDGKADHAVFRPSNGYWYILRSSDGAFSFQQFGTSTDKPLLGDFDGDRKSDLAYLQSVGSDLLWHVFQSTTNTETIQKFGIVGDKALASDFDGDGLTNIAVYRPSTSKWYTSTNPAINYGEKQWGMSGDVPAPGDFDGDGNSDLTVFRPGNSVWYVLRSGTDTVVAQPWGISTDIPVTAAFTP